MIKNIILLSSIMMLVVSCNNDKKKEADYATVNHTNKEVAITTNNTQNDGYTLMKNNCYVCHNPKAKSHDDIIAPPFKAVKMHYLREYDNREDFVNAMVNWVQNPDEEKALMFGAVNRFKVMPALPLETNDLKKIAAYIYDNEVEQPDWMPEHMKEMKGKMGKGMGKGKGKGMKGKQNN